MSRIQVPVFTDVLTERSRWQAPRHSRFLDHSSSPAKAGTMVLHNPNNWHWVNKDATAWAKDWFEENLTKLEVEDGETKARINKVISMDGDVDVSQRKGKVITIYDVKLVLEYSGTCPLGRYCFIALNCHLLLLMTAQLVQLSPAVG